MKIENAINSVGRRKESVARVKLVPGTGKLIVNGKQITDYFRTETLRMDIEQPLKVTNLMGQYDIEANIQGGGLSGQAGALRLGIARAILELNEDYRKALRSAGLLTRDPRAKERRKYGLAKARKRYQFSKR
jgi:small subunit ribosomal protein S9